MAEEERETHQKDQEKMTRLSNPTLKRAILFRYHDHLGICAERIELLRRLNPALPVWGLYGGAEPDKPRGLALDDDYALASPDPAFKWEHGDLCLREWFINRGRRFDFDMLHLIEWDLILLRPIEALFSHVTGGVALTDTKPLSVHRQENWRWITEREDQFQQLAEIIQSRHGVRLDRDNLLAGPFGGVSASRAFLERYAAEDIPLLLHDEIRMSAFAAAYNMKTHSTGLREKATLWNCGKKYYTAEQVYEESGRTTVFHPVQEELDINRLLR